MIYELCKEFASMLIGLSLSDRSPEQARDGLDHRFRDAINDLGPATRENLAAWIGRKIENVCPNLLRMAARRDSDAGACRFFGNKAA